MVKSELRGAGGRRVNDSLTLERERLAVRRLIDANRCRADARVTNAHQSRQPESAGADTEAPHASALLACSLQLSRQAALDEL
ncbi:MAG: hypothetical protein AAF628_10305 [Planctomycetota bacterium]